MLGRTWLLWLLVCGAPWCHAGEPVPGAAPTPEAIEQFERQVRPILSEHCWSCHGSAKQESGLRLDRREAVLRGADGGPVVVPGQPQASSLIAAVRREGGLAMPPDSALSADQVAILETWVRQGLAWPAQAEPAPGGPPALDDSYFSQVRQQHWSLRPIEAPERPRVRQADWPRRELDYYLLAELEAAGLAPAPPADRRTWLRRVTYDLTGLPPRWDEICEFEADQRPDARQQVVERLLASPQYGERWARHWLDVARYADTRGYVFTQDPRYAYAYTYRDYVVEALNRDLPFDQFVLEQLAADQLPPSEDRKSLAALGFLTLGRRFMNNPHDIIDDRIDVVARGLMGLTVGCARCHDHKYDPVTQADYYSLYGVFASSVEPEDLPIIAPPEETEAWQAHQRELAARRQALEEFARQEDRRLTDELRAQVRRYLVAAAQPPGTPPGEDPMVSYDPGDLRPEIVARWRDYLGGLPAEHPVLGVWKAVASAPGSHESSDLSALVARYSGASQTEQQVATNAVVRAALAELSEPTPTSLADRLGALLEEAYVRWTSAQRSQIWAAAAGRKAAPLAALPDPAWEELRQALWAEGNPTQVPRDKLQSLLHREASNRYRQLKSAIGEWEATSPAAPARAMVLVDAPAPSEPHIFLRGNPHRPGPSVPRQFLRVLRGPADQPFAQGSGRLELARAIVDRSNPLTARVIANRVWLHHFGRGLVATPSDFGTRGEPPTHPALLDYLAARLRDGGWSLKDLHRELVLSATYGQSSAERPEGQRVDPENRLLWRMNRRRLEFEALRDSLLAVAGQLDLTRGGRSVPMYQAPYSQRRTLYGLIDRQDLPGTLRVFDFASPDSSTPQRAQTTVPQQALFLMNSPFVAEQAKHLAQRSRADADAPERERLAQLIRLALGREPGADELDQGLAFLEGVRSSQGVGRAPDQAGEPGAGPDAWQQLAHALLMTNEFCFVD